MELLIMHVYGRVWVEFKSRSLSTWSENYQDICELGIVAILQLFLSCQIELCSMQFGCNQCRASNIRLGMQSAELCNMQIKLRSSEISHPGLIRPGVTWTLIARIMGPTWGPSGADRIQVGPMLAPWTVLFGQHMMVQPPKNLFCITNKI